MNRPEKKTSSRRSGAVIVLAVAMGLVGAACGSSSKSSTSATTTAKPAVACATGTASGAGSTFIKNLEQQWAKDFQNQCSGATINYQGVGSGAGIQQFTAGTVQFAGSDVPLSAAEQTSADGKYGPVLNIPWSAGGIAVEYNLSAVPNLQLDGAALAGIFAGTITKWNDPAIKALNAGATLPSSSITVVHRSDGSGTTAAYTAYLTAAAPTVWTAGAAKDVKWPAGQGAKGSDGVTAAVKQTEGAIGYAELSFAKTSGLGVAKIKNAGGQYVAPDADSVSAALKSATVPADLKVKVNYTPTDPAAYPITTDTFVIVPMKPTTNAALLKAFILYALGAGQKSAADLDYAPLPDAILTPATAAANSIQG